MWGSQRITFNEDWCNIATLSCSTTSDVQVEVIGYANDENENENENPPRRKPICLLYVTNAFAAFNAGYTRTAANDDRCTCRLYVLTCRHTPLAARYNVWWALCGHGLPIGVRGLWTEEIFGPLSGPDSLNRSVIRRSAWFQEERCESFISLSALLQTKLFATNK